jgi:hypothetical protein
MSDSENSTPSVDEAKKTASNLVSTVMELKQSNPKVFFGGIAGIVVLLVLVMSIGGGSEPVVPVTTLKDHVAGQNYVLRGVNSTVANGQVRIVQVPGSMAAYDDSEEDPKEAACNHLPAETQVKALAFQDFMGKKDAFINVEVLSGNCKGKKGWVLAVDVQ